jgi:hypothetical protein
MGSSTVEKGNPYTVECPHCQAFVGGACQTPMGQRTSYIHLERWQEVGIKHPTEVDYMRLTDIMRLETMRKCKEIFEMARQARTARSSDVQQ